MAATLTEVLPLIHLVWATVSDSLTISAHGVVSMILGTLSLRKVTAVECPSPC